MASQSSKPPSPEIYRRLDGVDNSYEALQERIMLLQPSLRALASKAIELFDDVYPQAAHPTQSRQPLTVYATHSMDFCYAEGIPMARELTIVMGKGRWLRIFRNTDSSPNEYPAERLWLWRPEGDVSRQVCVKRTNVHTRRDQPYDIETVDYDKNGQCLGFVGGGVYYGQEPYIAETDAALDDAQRVAEENGFSRKAT